MGSSFGIEIPRIEDDDLFEDLCLDLFKNDRGYENVQKNGRRGQRQDGVDIFARKVSSSEWLGLQCKVKSGGIIGEAEIDNEVKKAMGFNPKLTDYYIYTTAKRDSKIQEYVRIINNRNLRNGVFSVQIFFWEDIEHILQEGENKPIHFKYYKELYSTFEDDGYSLGKLLGLTVAYRQDKAHYELLIGKVFKTQESGYYGLNYWKNINYLLNMNERTFETFPDHCHPSDLERAICNARDRYIVCEWLNSLDSIEKLLKSDDQEYQFAISDQQFKEYLSRYVDCED